MKNVMVGVVTLLSIVLVESASAGKLLTGDEIKALITDKTVSVTVPNGAKWRQYFAPDGNSDRDSGEKSQWHVEDDKHCNTAAKKFPCAPIRSNDDGTCSRLKPDGGEAVKWTAIVDGKAF